MILHTLKLVILTIAWFTVCSQTAPAQVSTTTYAQFPASGPVYYGRRPPPCIPFPSPPPYHPAVWGNMPPFVPPFPPPPFLDPFQDIQISTDISKEVMDDGKVYYKKVTTVKIKDPFTGKTQEQKFVTYHLKEDGSGPAVDIPQSSSGTTSNQLGSNEYDDYRPAALPSSLPSQFLIDFDEPAKPSTLPEIDDSDED